MRHERLQPCWTPKEHSRAQSALHCIWIGLCESEKEGIPCLTLAPDAAVMQLQLRQA